MKRGTVFVVAIFLIFLISGCETTKGFSKGAVKTVEGVGTTISETAAGLAKDTYTGAVTLAGWIGAADDWIKENLW